MTADADAALDADGLVVPGVGAFAACMAGLRAVGGDEIIDKRLAGGRPVLGICVGMQVLFERGVEHGRAPRAAAAGRASSSGSSAPVLPHMGWNTVRAPAGSTLFAGLGPRRALLLRALLRGQPWPLPARRVARTAADLGQHGEDFVAAVENGPLAATQFHPEKSGDAGAALLPTGWGR